MVWIDFQMVTQERMSTKLSKGASYLGRFEILGEFCYWESLYFDSALVTAGKYATIKIQEPVRVGGTRSALAVFRTP